MRAPPPRILAALATPLLIVGTLTLSACDKKPGDRPPIPTVPTVPKPSAPAAPAPDARPASASP